MELRGGEKDIRFLRLWDTYQPLLTENKREITNLYFNCDLSVSEIAEEKGVSRQSVSDCLQTCRRQLEEYEEKLGFVKMLAQASLELSFLTTDLDRATQALKLSHPECAGVFEEILKKDYRKEAETAIAERADLQ